MSLYITSLKWNRYLEDSLRYVTLVLHHAIKQIGCRARLTL